MIYADCHPDRKYIAKGLCEVCYRFKRREAGSQPRKLYFLQPDEIPEVTSRAYDFQSQTIDSGKMQINRCCLKCASQDRVSINAIRRTIKRNGSLGLCTKCALKERSKNRYKPFLPNEVPESFLDLFDFESQDIEKGNRVIDTYCLECRKKRRVIVGGIRTNILNGTYTGLCKFCGNRSAAKRAKTTGTSSVNWKGGRSIDHSGYVLIYCPDDPLANARGHIQEHRLIMEEVMGRRLLPNETVHHKNGIRRDNRPENLELWGSAHPSGQRYENIETKDLRAWITYVEELLSVREVDAGISWG